ncbi:MAG: hypothetical protein JST55_15720 [Bacteroidetes bacterium]|nr:hypothetical protein [Bacteroidota bacterium]
MKKIFLAVIIFFTAVTLLNADGIYKRIKFEKGKSSFIFNGAVVGGDTDTYIFRAKKNQDLKVSITSVKDNAEISVIKDKTEKSLENMADSNKTKEFTGEITESGEYKILVKPSEGNASYKLYVELENRYFEF